MIDLKVSPAFRYDDEKRSLTELDRELVQKKTTALNEVVKPSDMNRHKEL